MNNFFTKGRTVAIPKGHVLFQDGRPYQPGFLDALYIMEGSVSYVKKSIRNKYVQIQLVQNDLIGLEGMYSEAYPATAMASQDCTLYQWSIENFELLIGMDIEFAVRVITSLSRHQRLINQEVLVRVTGQNGASETVETMLEIGKRHLSEGNHNEARRYFERIVTEHPAHASVKEVADYLTQLNQQQTSEEDAFDVTNQDGIDSDASIQYGLYNLAFQGKDSVSKDLYQKFGKTYQPGEMLFKEGDLGEELYLLLTGNVQVEKGDKVLATLKEGDIFGEMAIFENKPRSASIKALTEASVLALTRDNFKMIFQLNPSWPLQLINGFSSRITNCYHLLSR